MWAAEGVFFADDVDIVRSASSDVLERVVCVAEGGYSRACCEKLRNSQLSCISVGDFCRK